MSASPPDRDRSFTRTALGLAAAALAEGVLAAVLAEPVGRVWIPQGTRGDHLIGGLVLNLLILLWGGAWGSFLNVVAYRLPRGESIVVGGSHCPHCGRPIRPWHNVPVLGWLVLRGLCYDCRRPIAPRYAWVELATSTLFLWLWAGAHARGGPGAPLGIALDALGGWALAGSLVVLLLLAADGNRAPMPLVATIAILGAAVLAGWGAAAWMAGDRYPAATAELLTSRPGWLLRLAGAALGATFVGELHPRATRAAGWLTGAATGLLPTLAAAIILLAAGRLARDQKKTLVYLVLLAAGLATLGPWPALPR